MIQFIRNKRRQALQAFANLIVDQINATSVEYKKLFWYGNGLTLDTYCIVAFKMYLN